MSILQTLLSCHPEGITAHSQLFVPEHLSSEAKALLQEVGTCLSWFIHRGFIQTKRYVFACADCSDLTLKAPIITAADDNGQTIHMKCQDYFSLKSKKKIFFNVFCYKFCLAL